MRAFEMREGVDHGAVVHHDARAEHHVRLHGDVATEPRVEGEEHRSRSLQGRAVAHRGVAQTILQDRFGRRQLDPVVDPQGFALIGR